MHKCVRAQSSRPIRLLEKRYGAPLYQEENIGTWDHVHAETKQVMLIKKRANKVESINIPLGGHAFLNAFTWSHRSIEPEIDI